MGTLTDIRLLYAYGDEMNRRLLDAATAMDDHQLDAAYDIGMGTLRKTLVHVIVGEEVWLARWRGEAESRWRTFDAPPTPDALEDTAREISSAREAFFESLDDEKLDATQPYRDSAGSRFEATLREQILQGFVHSTHHRAQAVHMLKRAGGGFVEVDFMYWRRRPA